MCKHVSSLGKPAVCERMCHDFHTLDWRGWRCEVREEHAGGLRMISLTFKGFSCHSPFASVFERIMEGLFLEFSGSKSVLIPVLNRVTLYIYVYMYITV